MPMLPPVIVVPGITATTLRDEYPLDDEGVWGIVRKDYLRTALHPDDLRYEQIEPARVRPGEAFSLPYDELVKELRHDLSNKRDRPRPVFLFPHDWRQSLQRLVGELRMFCDEVAARTALLKHYARDGYTADEGQVDLVGHSMGGLIINGYLATHSDTHRARKVATLGTPYCGSFEAVLKIITGTADLGPGAPSSREREVARITPALYHLLPENHLNEAIRVADGLPRTLFDPGLWQAGVTESIAEHIRLNAVDPPSTKAGRLDAATALLRTMLDEARAFRERTLGFRLQDAGLQPDDWMTVVGVGEKTRVMLEVEDRDGEPFFVLDSLGRRNGYPEPETNDEGDITASLADTGDGTVPYWAAVPPFLARESLIAVSDDEFGYWELRDKLIAATVSTLHGFLPAMNNVIKLLTAFLQADAGKKGRAHDGMRGRRAPDVAPGAKWDPPIRGLEERMPRAMKALRG